MLLLFETDSHILRWCKVENNIFTEDSCDVGQEWMHIVFKDIGDIKRIQSIGYLLYNGGEEIVNDVNLLSRDFLKKVGRSIKFLPEHNDIIYKTANFLFNKLLEIKHLLFCDTAFFIDLPEEASTYALPYKLREKGVKKYGGYGLCHQWVWEKTQSCCNNDARKIISIYLGDHTNITAIRDGMPVETSIGFTPVEGILSSNSCGDIDPTIIFYLYTSGFTFDEINRLLSNESGLKALVGKGTCLSDILRNKNDISYSFALEVFNYNLVKYIGSFISVLGGVDTIVFTGEEVNTFLPFIIEICKRFDFLGMKCKKASKLNKNIWNLTEKNSQVKVFCFPYNKWEIMSEKAKTFQIKEK